MTKNTLNIERYLRSLSEEERQQLLSGGSQSGGAAPASPAQPATDSARAELQNMIGLEEVKTLILKHMAFKMFRKVASNRGKKVNEISSHMCFVGNPGTAKTTVARLYARLLKEEGLLTTGTFVEATRADLVGEYVGHTAGKVKKLFQKAEGGVLFIDEAYSLVDDRDGSFGDEAINTLVTEMENNRSNTVVILAGYPEKMEGFLFKNPGLASRAPFLVKFPDYSSEELCRITEQIAGKNGYSLGEDVHDKLMPIFTKAAKSPNFGNGRFARNLVEQAQLNHAFSLLDQDMQSMKDEDLFCLSSTDFQPMRTMEELHSKPVIGFS